MLNFPNSPTTGQGFNNWIFDGVKWSNQGTVLPRISLVFSFSGKPGASATIVVPVSIGLTLSANLPGSYADATVAAAASAAFTITKAGTSIGSVTFAAGATTGTFSFASSVLCVPGDYLTIVAPSTQDSALANVGITLLASRT